MFGLRSTNRYLYLLLLCLLGANTIIADTTSILLNGGLFHSENRVYVPEGTITRNIKTALVAVGQQRQITSNIQPLLLSSVKISSIDITPPRVSLIQIKDTPLRSGDFIPQKPLFIISLEEAESVLSTWNMQLLDSQNQTIQQAGGLLLQKGLKHASISLNITSSLSNGTYKLLTSISDSQGNTTQNNTLVCVQPNLAIDRYLIGPNPFNPNNETAHLQYQLSEPANICISIYSVNGKSIWRYTLLENEVGAQTGFNNIIWDGRDASGSLVPNGPYIAYIVATNSHGKAIAKIKILVLK